MSFKSVWKPRRNDAGGPQQIKQKKMAGPDRAEENGKDFSPFCGPPVPGKNGNAGQRRGKHGPDPGGAGAAGDEDKRIKKRDEKSGERAPRARVRAREAKTEKRAENPIRNPQKQREKTEREAGTDPQECLSAEQAVRGKRAEGKQEEKGGALLHKNQGTAENQQIEGDFRSEREQEKAENDAALVFRARKLFGKKEAANRKSEESCDPEPFHTGEERIPDRIGQHTDQCQNA